MRNRAVDDPGDHVGGHESQQSDDDDAEEHCGFLAPIGQEKCAHALPVDARAHLRLLAVHVAPEHVAAPEHGYVLPLRSAANSLKSFFSLSLRLAGSCPISLTY